MENEVLMEMLKEQMANNGRQPLKGNLPERSHVCSTKEEKIPDINESFSRDKGKRKAELPKFNAAVDRQVCEPQKQPARAIVFVRLRGKMTQSEVRLKN